MKRRAGEAKYGTDADCLDGSKPRFRGDPLVELHDELLDAMNYCGYLHAFRGRSWRVAVVGKLLTVCRRLVAAEFVRGGCVVSEIS